MGTPKALLRLGGQTFVDLIFGRMRAAGLGRVAAVIGAHRDRIRNEACSEDLEWVINEDHRRGQLSSLWCGLNAVGDADGAMMTLVDHPLVTAETYRDLVLEFNKNPDSIVIPVVDGRRGHPIVFGRKHFQRFLDAPLEVGARWVVGSGEVPVHEVVVTDPGIRADIDNRNDYDRWVGGVGEG